MMTMHEWLALTAVVAIAGIIFGTGIMLGRMSGRAAAAEEEEWDENTERKPAITRPEPVLAPTVHQLWDQITDPLAAEMERQAAGPEVTRMRTQMASLASWVDERFETIIADVDRGLDAGPRVTDTGSFVVPLRIVRPSRDGGRVRLPNRLGNSGPGGPIA